MGMKQKIVDFAERSMSKNQHLVYDKPVHSKAYHRYFEGYSEHRELRRDGGTRIVRIYTGAYHVQRLTKAQAVFLRLVYVALFLLSCAAFILAALRRLSGPLSWIVPMPQALAAIGYIWTMPALAGYLLAGRRMTVDDYRETKALALRTRIVAAIVAAAALVELIYGLIIGLGAGILPNTGLFLLSAAAICSVGEIERKIPYEIQENETKPMYGDTPID